MTYEFDLVADGGERRFAERGLDAPGLLALVEDLAGTTLRFETRT